MSKFEKNLIKYLSYGFCVGIYYSFIKGPTLSISFILSLIAGVVYTIVFLCIKGNK